MLLKPWLGASISVRLYYSEAMDLVRQPERTMVLGGSGFLGRWILGKLMGHGATIGTYLSQPLHADLATETLRLDLTDRKNVIATIRSAGPAVVINAAYRHGDWETTATGAANVAIGAAEAGAHLVHISSDAVFSGKASGYSENARPDPITPYGAAKASAETAVHAVLPSATIIRTSLIVGDRGDSEHERRTYDAARGSGALFRDDVRCPVHVSDLAGAVAEFAQRREPGIFHVAGEDAISRYHLGKMIASRDGLDPDTLAAMDRADLPNPGPIDVRLECASTQSLLATRLRGAIEFLSPS